MRVRASDRTFLGGGGNASDNHGGRHSSLATLLFLKPILPKGADFQVGSLRIVETTFFEPVSPTPNLAYFSLMKIFDPFQMYVLCMLIFEV